MIITSNKHRQTKHEDAQKEWDWPSTFVFECCPEHETGRINHTQLVYKLHWILQSGVERKASNSDKKVADESDQKYPIMAMRGAIVDPLDTEVQEEEVGERIDNFR
jgi:hypothetical protein